MQDLLHNSLRISPLKRRVFLLSESVNNLFVKFMASVGSCDMISYIKHGCYYDIPGTYRHYPTFWRRGDGTIVRELPSLESAANRSNVDNRHDVHLTS